MVLYILQIYVFGLTRIFLSHSAILYEPFHYLITAEKDGCIKIWSYILETELFTLSGHFRPVTSKLVYYK